MRVNIQSEQKQRTRGLIFKKVIPYVEVVADVQFTEEELTVIRDNGLGETIILERDAPYLNRLMNERIGPDLDPSMWHLRIRHLVKGRPEKYNVQNMAAANIYRAELEDALRNLKEFINQNATVREPTKFEI